MSQATDALKSLLFGFRSSAPAPNAGAAAASALSPAPAAEVTAQPTNGTDSANTMPRPGSATGGFTRGASFVANPAIHHVPSSQRSSIVSMTGSSAAIEDGTDRYGVTTASEHRAEKLRLRGESAIDIEV
jgi:hypothetical protein